MISALKQLLGMGPKVDLSQLIREGATILDVRTKGEYSQGHIKGSVNVPLDQVAAYAKKLKDKDKAIITCCASGMRSSSAKGILKSQGFTNVHNGGGWSSLVKHTR
jgi:rhodanese-related sulfurtransferase